MRLRYLAAGPLVAAAMFGSTAAAWPSATADPPQAPPALTASALAARYAADAQAIGTAERAAARDGDSQLAGALAALRRRALIVLRSRPARAWPSRCSATWPGHAGGHPRARLRHHPGHVRLPGHGLARRRRPRPSRPGALAGPGRRLAIIAWLGYAAPAMLSPAVLTSGDAGQGAQALRPLVDELARHGHQVALICHSYGSVVCGLAAPHLPVTDIAVFGSPGMDASSVRPRCDTTRPGVGGPGDRRLRSATCRTSSCSGWASAPTRCRPGSAPGSSPPAAAATAATSDPGSGLAAQPGLHRAG